MNAGPARAVRSEINVTPLVDVVLVLLIIFMVVTPLLEQDIEVKMPDEASQPGDDIPFVVAIDAAGALKINGEAVSSTEYTARMRTLLQARRANDRLVFFMPDEGVSYSKVIEAVDGAKLAGASALGMMTDPPN